VEGIKSCWRTKGGAVMQRIVLITRPEEPVVHIRFQRNSCANSVHAERTRPPPSPRQEVSGIASSLVFGRVVCYYVSEELLRVQFYPPHSVCVWIWWGVLSPFLSVYTTSLSNFVSRINTSLSHADADGGQKYVTDQAVAVSIQQ